MSIGPILIASISGYVFGGNAIGYGLATAIAIFCPLAAIVLALGCGSMREASIAAEKLDEQ